MQRGIRFPFCLHIFGSSFSLRTERLFEIETDKYNLPLAAQNYPTPPTMRKIRNVIITCCVLLVACQNNLHLKSDQYLTKIFTKNEISEIEKLISYVDNIIITQTGEKNINNAYHQFLNSVNQSIKDSIILVPIEINKKYQFLESLDPVLLNDFFTLYNNTESFNVEDSNDENNYEDKYLNFNPTGRYMDYLDLVSSNDDFYKTLKESIVLAGDIPFGTMFYYFPQNHQSFDFTIPKNRLFVSLFVLRLEKMANKKLM